MPTAGANKTYTFHTKSKVDNQEWLVAIARSIGQDPPTLKDDGAIDRADSQHDREINSSSICEQAQNPLSGALGRQWTPEEAEL